MDVNGFNNLIGIKCLQALKANKSKYNLRITFFSSFDTFVFQIIAK